jgi:hypothetical protein
MHFPHQAHTPLDAAVIQAELKEIDGTGFQYMLRSRQGAEAAWLEKQRNKPAVRHFMAMFPRVIAALTFRLLLNIKILKIPLKWFDI